MVTLEPAVQLQCAKNRVVNTVAAKLRQLRNSPRCSQWSHRRRKQGKAGYGSAGAEKAENKVQRAMQRSTAYNVHLVGTMLHASGTETHGMWHTSCHAAQKVHGTSHHEVQKHCGGWISFLAGAENGAASFRAVQSTLPQGELFEYANCARSVLGFV